MWLCAVLHGEAMRECERQRAVERVLGLLRAMVLQAATASVNKDQIKKRFGLETRLANTNDSSSGDQRDQMALGALQMSNAGLGSQVAGCLTPLDEERYSQKIASMYSTSDKTARSCSSTRTEAFSLQLLSAAERRPFLRRQMVAGWQASRIVKSSSRCWNEGLRIGRQMLAALAAAAAAATAAAAGRSGCRCIRAEQGAAASAFAELPSCRGRHGRVGWNNVRVGAWL